MKLASDIQSLGLSYLRIRLQPTDTRRPTAKHKSAVQGVIISYKGIHDALREDVWRKPFRVLGSSMLWVSERAVRRSGDARAKRAPPLGPPRCWQFQGLKVADSIHRYAKVVDKRHVSPLALG